MNEKVCAMFVKLKQFDFLSCLLSTSKGRYWSFSYWLTFLYDLLHHSLKGLQVKTFFLTRFLFIWTQRNTTRMNEVTCNSMPYNTLSASATTNNNNNINFYNSQWYLQRLMHALKKSKFPLYFKFRDVAWQFQIVIDVMFI